MDAQPIVVNAGEASAIVTRNPVRISFRDGAGGSCSRRSQTGCPARSSSRRRSTPSPAAWTSCRRRRCTRRSRSPWVGSGSSRTRARARSWATSCRRSAAGSSTRRARSWAPGAAARGARLELSTNDPSGRRLLVTLSAAGPPRDPRLGEAASSARASPSSRTRSPPAPSEAFHGFGGRHNALDQRGHALESFLNQTNLSGPGPRGRARPARPLHVPERPDGGVLRPVLVRLVAAVRLPVAARRADALAHGQRPPRCVAGGRVGAGPGLRRCAGPRRGGRSAR